MSIKKENTRRTKQGTKTRKIRKKIKENGKGRTKEQ